MTTSSIDERLDWYDHLIKFVHLKMSHYESELFPSFLFEETKALHKRPKGRLFENYCKRRHTQQDSADLLIIEGDMSPFCEVPSGYVVNLEADV